MYIRNRIYKVIKVKIEHIGNARLNLMSSERELEQLLKFIAN